jgi:hypothetical protein
MSVSEVKRVLYTQTPRDSEDMLRIRIPLPMECDQLDGSNISFDALTAFGGLARGSMEPQYIAITETVGRMDLISRE